MTSRRTGIHLSGQYKDRETSDQSEDKSTYSWPIGEEEYF